MTLTGDEPFLYTDVDILVTGGTGCLGSHLLGHLAERGDNVFALIRENSDVAHIENSDRIRFLKGDLIDLQSIRSQFPRIQAVVHCAAQTPFSSNFKIEKGDFVRANIVATENVARISKELGVNHLIYISSASVMGDNYDGERNETFSCYPESDYARSKLEGENLLRKFFDEGHFQITILRPSLIYGAYDRNGMWRMIDLIYKNRFVLFGDGENYKSLASAKNVVEAIVCSLESPNALGKTFLVNDGSKIKLNDMVRLVLKSLNRTSTIFHVPGFLCPALGVISIAEPARLVLEVVSTLLTLGYALRLITCESYLF